MPKGQFKKYYMVIGYLGLVMVNGILSVKKPFPVRILMSTIFRVGSVSTHTDNILMT